MTEALILYQVSMLSILGLEQERKFHLDRAEIWGRLAIKARVERNLIARKIAQKRMFVAMSQAKACAKAAELLRADLPRHASA
jgi:hypothetical protein